MHNAPLLMRGGRTQRALMHVDDAAARNIADGDTAMVRSPFGEIAVPVALTVDIVPGTIAIPHGWGHRGTGGWRIANRGHSLVQTRQRIDTADIDRELGEAEQSLATRPDDQRLTQTVESLRVMPNVKRLLADRGTTFERNFVSLSNCCPSRTTFLTGQYAHNHGVLENSWPLGGVTALDATETLPVWLRRAGYETIHVGKYLNGYGFNRPADVPPGWSDWHATVDKSTYQMWGFTLSALNSWPVIIQR